MYFKPSPSNYALVSRIGKDEDTTETLIPHHFDSDNSLGHDQSDVRPNHSTRYRVYFIHGSLLLSSLIFFCLWIHARTRLLNTYSYSPANAAIENDNNLVFFNGSFEFPSIYRGPPTSEIDATWANISSRVKLASLTREQLIKLGKEDTPSKVKYLPEYGGGYMGALEVVHQLHCLNGLRKYLYFDHYSKFDTFFKGTTPKIYRTHLEHCIEILRQSLMCTADTGMITFEWVKGYSNAYPDFNTQHKCRDFKKLIDWQNTHGVHGIPKSHIVRQEGQVDLETPP